MRRPTWRRSASAAGGCDAGLNARPGLPHPRAPAGATPGRRPGPPSLPPHLHLRTATCNENHRHRHRLRRPRHRRLPRRDGQRRRSAWTSTQRKIDLLSDGGMPIHEPGLDELVAAQRRRRPPALHHRRRRGRSRTARCSSSPSARRPTRTARPTCSTCWPRPRNIGRLHDRATRSSSTRAPCRSAPPTRCARRSPTSSPTRGVDDRLRRRLQPRVPQGRRGGRRLHAPGPRRRRRRRRARASQLMRALYAPFMRNRDRLLVMDMRSRRAHQVRGQRHARHAHQLHERAGATWPRSVGADIEIVRQGIGSRPAHRLPVPVPRRRLRRLVLPEGRARRWSRTGARRTASTLQLLQRRGARQRARRSACWSRRSSSTSATTSPGKTFARLGPGLQAEHRRHARGAGRDADRGAARARAPRCAPTTRWRCTRRGASSATRRTSRYADSAEAALRGRRRAGHRHRVEGVPQPGLRRASRRTLKTPVIFDGRNLYDPALMRALGFEYHGIGRGASVRGGGAR